MKLLQSIQKVFLRAFLFLRYRSASQQGLAALEYIAIAVLIVVAVAGAFAAFGDQLEQRVDSLFSDIFNN